ncbi:endophilin-A3-like isoform X2 [Anneissia japonica]|uniref:endophilin-A3-like isoform X2 n=1 Tax=Anneissia japonica TaxID=1529436 RepID=UPI0014257C80|nr:endophilin-A3-like isoform X2 [Anneissia japonica]
MSFSGFKKQINKANQYMSEKIGGAERTKMDEEFLEMEKTIDFTEHAVDEVMAKTVEFLQPNPVARAKLSTSLTVSKMRGQAKTARYVQAESILGDCMVKSGTELGEDSSFGHALVDCGESMKQLGDVRDSFDISVRQNFLEPLNHLKQKDLKEVNHHRKKVDSRRLDFDFKKKKLAKVGNNGSNLPEDEVRVAEEKFEESLRLAEDGMKNIIESDVEQVRQLQALVEAQLDYHRQAMEIMERLQETLEDRVTEAEARPRMERKPLRSSKNSYNNDMNGAVKNEYTDATFSVPPPAAPTFDVFSTDFEEVLVNDSNEGEDFIGYSVNSNTNAGGPSECCKALYDFEAENDGELDFKEGDIITITQKIDENWLEGSIDGRTGFFPSNYVEVQNL